MTHSFGFRNFRGKMSGQTNIYAMKYRVFPLWQVFPRDNPDMKGEDDPAAKNPVLEPWSRWDWGRSAGSSNCRCSEDVGFTWFNGSHSKWAPNFRFGVVKPFNIGIFELFCVTPFFLPRGSWYLMSWKMSCVCRVSQVRSCNWPANWQKWSAEVLLELWKHIDYWSRVSGNHSFWSTFDQQVESPTWSMWMGVPFHHFYLQRQVFPHW